MGLVPPFGDDLLPADAEAIVHDRFVLDQAGDDARVIVERERSGVNVTTPATLLLNEIADKQAVGRINDRNKNRQAGMARSRFRFEWFGRNDKERTPSNEATHAT